MRIDWKPTQEDVERVQELVRKHSDNSFVRHRERSNLQATPAGVEKDRFWHALVAGLMTTQQRSSPGSPIVRFLSLDPLPLRWELCAEHADLYAYAAAELTAFGGIRNCHKVLPGYLQTNRDQLQGSFWPICQEHIETLRPGGSLQDERQAARLMADSLKGIGPKQARNVLQMLGLTRQVIPLDSRFARWLRKQAFPVSVSATALSDESYYSFVEDGIGVLCEAAGVAPCILDACVFVDGEKRTWTDSEIFWW